MIDIDIKAKSFGDNQVLGKIQFSIGAGETVALLGPSGVGKTTLLRIVSGLDKAFEGNITRPDKMAMVFQEPTLLPWRSVRDNITLVTDIDGQAAESALERVGLGNKSDLFPSQLSLGQRRRLALARALAAKPEFLIMDEPFVSLDQKLIGEMVALSKSLLAERKISTLFVTHSEIEAHQLADRTLRIDGQPASLI